MNSVGGEAGPLQCWVRNYFLPLACDKALPAADLDAALVRPSRSTLEAAVATRADVCSLGALFLSERTACRRFRR